MLKNRMIAGMCAFILAFSAMPHIKVYAEKAEWINAENQYEEEGRLPSGGYNTFFGQQCADREETQELEKYLNSRDDYVQISGNGSTISEDDYNVLFENKSIFQYYMYLDKEDEYYWKYYKVYVKKSLYDKIVPALRNGETVNTMTRAIFSTSAVVIDYAVWYHKERVGQVVQDFNDNIPLGYYDEDSGFVQIVSPIDAKVTLGDSYSGTFNVFYVKANEPFLVKLHTGAYYIDDINTTGINVKEETLSPYKNNTFYIDGSYTEKSPYVAELEAAVEKYDIQPYDISGKPDYSWDNRDSLEIETYMDDRTFTDSEQDQMQESSNPPVTEIKEETVSENTETVNEPVQLDKSDSTVFWRKFFIIVFILIALTVIVSLEIIKRNNRNQ